MNVTEISIMFLIAFENKIILLFSMLNSFQQNYFLKEILLIYLFIHLFIYLLTSDAVNENSSYELVQAHLKFSM